MLAPIKYRSKAAAERAKNRVERDVPQARVEITKDNTLLVWCYYETLSPSEREAVDLHEHRRPRAPSPLTPMFGKIKKVPKIEWRQSKIDDPAAVAMAIYDRYKAEGRIDDRKEAVQEAIEAGVNPNTARTYYARYRERMGLPSLQQARRRLKARSTVRLSAKPPAGLKVCNGVQEPGYGTRAREIWDMCDVLQRKLDRPPKLGEVRESLPATARETTTKQYQRWRKFHAIPPQGQFHRRSK